MSTCLRRHRFLRVVILSKQSPNSKPRTPKMLDVEVQMLGSVLSAAVNNFHLHTPKLQRVGHPPGESGLNT